MKKIIILSVAVVLVVSCVVFGVVYKDDLSYLLSTKRKIRLDDNTATQSVMTFNVRCISSADTDEFSWKYRASLICDLLQEETPSVICMQENKKRQYSFFKKFLSCYDSVATYRDSSVFSECLPIFYRADMYELIGKQTFWLSDTPEKMSNTWGAEHFRICTFVILKNKNTGKEFIVANVHLDYKSRDIRIKSIRLIYERLSKFNLPTIVMGDFNFTPKSKAAALAKKCFADVGQGFGDENKGTFNNFENEYRNKKLDYMLQIPGSFTVNKYKVIDKKYNNHFASDHFPVYAEIE